MASRNGDRYQTSRDVNPDRHNTTSLTASAPEQSYSSGDARPHRDQRSRQAPNSRSSTNATRKNRQYSGDDSDDDSDDDDSDDDDRILFYMPSTDIDIEVLVQYLKEYLGEDSDAEPGLHPQRPKELGYFVKSRLGLSREMMADLRLDTRSWRMERGKQRRTRYSASNTWRSRLAQGPSGEPSVLPGKQAASTPRLEQRRSVQAMSSAKNDVQRDPMSHQHHAGPQMPSRTGMNHEYGRPPPHAPYSLLPDPRTSSNPEAMLLPSHTDRAVDVLPGRQPHGEKVLNGRQAAAGMPNTSADIAAISLSGPSRLAIDVASGIGGAAIGAFGTWDGYRSRREAQQITNAMFKETEQSLEIRRQKYQARERSLDRRKTKLDEEEERQRKTGREMERQKIEHEDRVKRFATQLQTFQLKQGCGDSSHKELEKQLRVFEDERDQFKKRQTNYEKACIVREKEVADIHVERRDLYDAKKEFKIAQTRFQTKTDELEAREKALEESNALRIKEMITREEELAENRQEFESEKQQLRSSGATLRERAKELAQKIAVLEHKQAAYDEKKRLHDESISARRAALDEKVLLFENLHAQRMAEHQNKIDTIHNERRALDECKSDIEAKAVKEANAMIESLVTEARAQSEKVAELERRGEEQREELEAARSLNEKVTEINTAQENNEKDRKTLLAEKEALQIWLSMIEAREKSLHNKDVGLKNQMYDNVSASKRHASWITAQTDAMQGEEVFTVHTLLAAKSSMVPPQYTKQTTQQRSTIDVLLAATGSQLFRPEQRNVAHRASIQASQHGRDANEEGFKTVCDGVRGGNTDAQIKSDKSFLAWQVFGRSIEVPGGSWLRGLMS